MKYARYMCWISAESKQGPQGRKRRGREMNKKRYLQVRSAWLSLGAVTLLLSGKTNAVLSSKPFKDSSGDKKRTKTNLMNKMLCAVKSLWSTASIGGFISARCVQLYIKCSWKSPGSPAVKRQLEKGKTWASNVPLTVFMFSPAFSIFYICPSGSVCSLWWSSCFIFDRHWSTLKFMHSVIVSCKMYIVCVHLWLPDLHNCFMD